MKTITTQELFDLLLNSNGAQPTGFAAMTAVKAIQKDRITGRPNPYKSIYKFSRCNPFVGTSYQNAINNQLEREGSIADFVAGSAQYDHIGGLLVRYRTTGNVCLACQFNNAKTQARKPIYLVDAGKGLQIVDKVKVNPFLPAESAPKNQGTQKQIIWRTFGIKNIRSLSFKKETYRIRG